MKKMICEVCGGSNFLKENGVFDCQICGMKYSLAEAKKLVKEVSDTEQSVNYAENNSSNDDYSTKDLCDSGCANSSNNSVLDDDFDYEGFNEFAKIDYKNDFISKYSDSEIIKIASQTDFRDDSKDFAHVFYEMKKIDDNPNSTGRVSIAQALPYFISLEKAHANLNEDEYLDVKTLYFFLLSFTEIKEYNTYSSFFLTKILFQHFNALAPIEKYMVNGDTEIQEIIKGYDIYNSDDPRLKDIRPKKGFVNNSKNESSNSKINVSKSDENANSNTNIEDLDEKINNARIVFEQETLPKFFWGDTLNFIEKYDNKTIYELWEKQIGDVINPYNLNDFSIYTKQINNEYTLAILNLPTPKQNGQLYCLVGVYNFFNDPRNLVAVEKKDDKKALYFFEGLQRYNAPFAICNDSEDEVQIIKKNLHSSSEIDNNSEINVSKSDRNAEPNTNIEDLDEKLNNARITFEQKTLTKLFWEDTENFVDHYSNETIYKLWEKEISNQVNSYAEDDFSIYTIQVSEEYKFVVVNLPTPSQNGQSYCIVGVYKLPFQPCNYVTVEKREDKKELYFFVGLQRCESPFETCDINSDELKIIKNTIYECALLQHDIKNTLLNRSNEQYYINADDFINSYKIEEIINIASHSHMLKMSDGLDGIKVSQSIKNGSTGDLSVAQITCLIISLQDAKKNLSATEYRDVETLFLFLQSFKDKKNYDNFELEQTSKVIIQHFNVLAPYKYYSGNKDDSIAETLLYNWGLIDASANYKRFTPYKGYTNDYLTKTHNNQATSTFQPLHSNIESNKAIQSSKSNSFSILKLIIFMIVLLVVIISLQGLGNSRNDENDNSNFGPSETATSEENDNSYLSESDSSTNETISVTVGTMHFKISGEFKHVETDSDYMNYYFNERKEQGIYYDVLHGSIDYADETAFEDYCPYDNGCEYGTTTTTVANHKAIYATLDDGDTSRLGKKNVVYYIQLNSTDIAQLIFSYYNANPINIAGILKDVKIN